MRKTKKTMKAFVLSMAMAAMMLPLTMSAQFVKNNTQKGQDGFFQSNGEYFNRSTNSEITGNFDHMAIGGSGQSTPLGSGLLITLACGAGYVVLKKKKNK